MASDEVSSHQASDRSSKVNTEESDTSETEAAIGESSCSSSGKFRSDMWKYFTNVLAGRELCAICATRSMRTLERQVTSVIIYSVIIKINTGLNLILMGRSGT